MALTYLKIKLPLFKEVYFIDNSTDEAIIRATIKDNILNEYVGVNPAWLSDVLSLYKRLSVIETSLLKAQKEAFEQEVKGKNGYMVSLKT